MAEEIVESENIFWRKDFFVGCALGDDDNGDDPSEEAFDFEDFSDDMADAVIPILW